VPSTSFLVPLPKSDSNNLRKWFLSPTGQLNFGFITEGKLTVVLITPYAWGSQLVVNTTHQQVFWRCCRGERGFLQGESLTSNLFTLLLFCLVSLLYFFASFLSKIQKISFFYSCYFCWYVIVLLYHAFYQWLVSLKLDLIGKVGSWKNNKNIMRNTACHKKGNTYRNKLINYISLLETCALLIMLLIALINLVVVGGINTPFSM
jgi:hypothetical protein